MPDKRDISDILQTSIHWLLALIVFLLPLIFINYSYSSYAMPKLILIRMGIYLIILLWVVRAIYSGELRIKRTILYLPLLILILIALVTTIFSIDPQRSLWGSYKRFEGLVTFFTYALLFLVTINIQWRKKDIKRLIWLMTFSAFLVSVYGVLQFFKLDLPSSPSNSDNIISSLGSPTFLAGYLLMVFPISLFQFTESLSYFLVKKREVGKKRRVINYLFHLVSLLTPFLISFALVFTGLKLGYLLFFLTLVFVFYKVRRHSLFNPSARRIFTVTIIILFLVSTPFFVNNLKKESDQFIKGLNIPQKISPLERMSLILEKKKYQLQERYELWKIGARMVAKRPIIGYGLDTFDLIFPEYMNDAYQKARSKILFFEKIDRVGIDTLQIAINTGIFGAGVFLWFIFALFSQSISSLRRIKKGEEYFFLLCLISSALAYFIFLQFSFSSIQVTPLFWIMLGLIIAVRKDGKKKKEFILKFSAQEKMEKWLKRGALILLIIGLFPLWYIIKPIVADIYILKSVVAYEKGKALNSVRYADKATSLNDIYDRYAVIDGWCYFFYATTSKDNEARNKYFSRAESLFFKAISLSPRNANNSLNLSNFYLYTPLLYDTAIELLTNILKKDKYNVEALVYLGTAYEKKDEPERAIEKYEKAKSINPRTLEAYFALGESYYKIGKLDKAKENLSDYLEAQPVNQEKVKRAKQILQEIKLKE